MKIKNTIKLKTYDILSDKIEDGIIFGWRRAHKHINNPDFETIKQNIYDEIMNSLGEVLDYGD